MRARRIAKCTGVITNENKEIEFVDLKYNNGHTERLGVNVVRDKMTSNDLGIINMTFGAFRKPELLKTIYPLSDYRYLMDGAPKSEKAERMAIKAKMLDCLTPDFFAEEERKLVNGTLVVTDDCNGIVRNIRIRGTGLFIGTEPLSLKKNKKFLYIPSITCDEAIIMNPSVMESILPDLKHTKSSSMDEHDIIRIRIKARVYNIKHDFVDINTIYEALSVFELLHSSMSDDSCDFRKLIIVDFKGAGISFDTVQNVVTEIVYDRLDEFEKYLLFKDKRKYIEGNLLAAMQLALSMYISTEYSKDYMLELADMCRLALRKYELSVDNWLRELSIIQNKLISGWRY